MKQVFRTQQGIKVVDVQIPSINENEVLVKVHRSMISTGTETMTLRKEQVSLSNKLKTHKKNLDKLKKMVLAEGFGKSYKFIKYKLKPSPDDIDLSPIGYSNSGVIVATGSKVMNFNIGDRVACAGSGIAAHAEYVAVPRNLVVAIPENVTFEQAAFTTIGSIAIQGLRRANVTFGDTIVITGLGLIGLLSVQIAKAWGLTVIALDIDYSRIALAKQLGADYAYYANLTELDSIIKSLTSGNGADAVVVCAATKSDAPVNQAMHLCRRKGTVTIVGSVGMNVERDQMYLKEIDLLMSTSYGPGRYDDQYEKAGIDYPIGYVKWTENRNMAEFVRLLASGKMSIEPLISNTFIIENAAKAFNYLVDSRLKPIGALLKYTEDNSIIASEENAKKVRPIETITSDKIRIGIIGTGGFIQGNHLPNLQSLNRMFDIKAICDKNHVTAANLARKYHTSYSTTDYKEIIADNQIDAIIIGTRHNLHAQLAIESLAAGKHVLVEKPVAMTMPELDQLDDIVRHSNKHLTVGFNRRYSPFAIFAQDILKYRISAVLMTYRINAGSYPLDNWIHDPVEGGGRIIGEGCHFIDFISCIVNAPVKEYDFKFIPLDGRVIHAYDNVSLNLSFEDGSLANMIYTSIGNKAMDKERIEIYCDYKTLVIDNFMSMNCYGTKAKNINLNKMDKGFVQELIEFGQVIKEGKIPSLSWQSIYDTTKITIDVTNQIKGN